MTDLGLAFAILAALSWGTFFVPVKATGIKNIWQLQGATSFGIILFAIPVGFFWGFEIQLSGIVSGIIWTIANLLALLSVRLIGLSKTSPLLAGSSIVSSFLWGTIFIKETFDSLFLAVLAIGLLLLGLQMIVKSENSLRSRKGYVVAIISGLVGGSYVIPMQVTNSLQTGFFSSSLSILLVSSILFSFSRKFIKKEIISGMVSGGIFNLGSASVLIATGLIGITIAFPISQTATLFAISWGIFYFKEVIKHKNIVRILIGVIVILSGSVILSIA